MSGVGALPANPRFTIAVVIALVASAAIAGAWIFQAVGYLPCELCLKQRYAYYGGVRDRGDVLAYALRRDGRAASSSPA